MFACASSFSRPSGADPPTSGHSRKGGSGTVTTVTEDDIIDVTPTGSTTSSARTSPSRKKGEESDDLDEEDVGASEPDPGIVAAADAAAKLRRRPHVGNTTPLHKSDSPNGPNAALARQSAPERQLSFAAAFHKRGTSDDKELDIDRVKTVDSDPESAARLKEREDVKTIIRNYYAEKQPKKTGRLSKFLEDTTQSTASLRAMFCKKFPQEAHRFDVSTCFFGCVWSTPALTVLSSSDTFAENRFWTPPQTRTSHSATKSIKQ